MDNQGWIKLHRKLLNSSIFSSEKGLKVWIWCLLKANHKAEMVFNGRQKIEIKTGQFITGKNVASKELDMAVGTIWFWFDQLEKDKYIERKSTNKYSIVTVLNYDKYQETERRLNADRTQIEQQIEPNNNDKNEKNDNNRERDSLKSLTYLINIEEDDLRDMCSFFNCTTQQIKVKGEQLYNYCLSKGKRYKNYKAFLRNALDKDFKRREKPLQIKKSFTTLDDIIRGKNYEQ